MPLVLDIQTITAAIWPTFQDESGKILDEYSIRKWAFYKGVDNDIRAELWRFLLNYYPFSSTKSERKEIDIKKRSKYEELCYEVAYCSEPESAAALAKYRRLIVNDCLRTDCHLSFYQGEEGSENVAKLQRILSCFVLHDAEMGYVQGMNELLSPLLQVLDNEHQAFWCLTNVLQRMNAIFSDLTLSQPLNSLARLCCYADKQIHNHIDSVYEGEDWVFFYRNVLLLFRREFTIEEICSLWETIWCDHMTRYFELFVSVAVLIHNRERILECSTVESFMEFSMKLSAGTIPLASVMSIARSLVEQLKSDEYCPYELRYLVSNDGCAPPPLVGFVRARQKFSTLHSNKINTQRLEIQRSMFGELFIEPVSPQKLSLVSPAQLVPATTQSHTQLPSGNSTVKQPTTPNSPTMTPNEPATSTPPPRTGFVPRAQMNGVNFRDDIRKASLTSPPPLMESPSPAADSIIPHSAAQSQTIQPSASSTKKLQSLSTKNTLHNDRHTHATLIPHNEGCRQQYENGTPQPKNESWKSPVYILDRNIQSCSNRHIVTNGQGLLNYVANSSTGMGEGGYHGDNTATLAESVGTKELQCDFDHLRSDAELSCL